MADALDTLTARTNQCEKSLTDPHPLWLAQRDAALKLANLIGETDGPGGTGLNSAMEELVEPLEERIAETRATGLLGVISQLQAMIERNDGGFDATDVTCTALRNARKTLKALIKRNCAASIL